MSEVDALSAEPADRVRQAAIFLLSLGEQEAANVLRHLEPREVQRVGAAMAELSDISTGSVAGVMDSFLKAVTGESGLSIGASDYVKRMFATALGEGKGRALFQRILSGNSKGLDKLRWMDSRGIADFILHEHPQIQAIVLSYLEPNQAAEVLDYFTNDEARIEVLVRVASLETVPPSALEELNTVLETEVADRTITRVTHLGGKKVAAEILNHVGGGSDEELMEGIRGLDEQLGDQISELMFIFDNLMDVDDRDIQTLLRELSTDNLVVALKGADEPLREKIFGNMSSRAAELLKDDMEAKGPVRVSDVETAQKEILLAARRLADAGEITIGGAGGEEML